MKDEDNGDRRPTKNQLNSIFDYEDDEDEEETKQPQIT
jgi:hypothetical protein